MSVVDPRRAAAQRTAASRIRVLAGAATVDQTSPAARAADKLPKDTKTVVQLPASKEDDLLGRLTHQATLVCTVDATQLAVIQRQWRTSMASLTVDKRTISVVSVYDAKANDLRTALGNPTCVLVQVAKIFFLPFDAHTS